MVVRRRRRRAVRPSVPRPGDRCGPARRHRGDLPRVAGGARTRRRICICGPTPSIDRTRCGRTRWAPIPRRTTGLRGTRRAVRGQRRRHPLGGMVRDHRIVAQHLRGARPVVREPAGTPILVRPREDLVEYLVEHAPGPEGDRFLIVTNLRRRIVSHRHRSGRCAGRWNDWNVYGAEDPATRIHRGARVRLGGRGVRPARGRRDADGVPVRRSALRRLARSRPAGW